MILSLSPSIVEQFWLTFLKKKRCFSLLSFAGIYSCTALLRSDYDLDFDWATVTPQFFELSQIFCCRYAGLAKS